MIGYLHIIMTLFNYASRHEDMRGIEGIASLILELDS
jgi:hypothetical protein